MKLSISNDKSFSYVNYFLQKLLCILANKNKSIGAMYYGNVCQNSHTGTSAYKIVATNFIGVSVSKGYHCIIV